MTYEEFGKIPADKNAFPESCSFLESTFYIAEAAQNNFNETFMQIGINELAVLESTGSVVVYEAKSMKEIIDKVKGLFVKLWEAIKRAYEAVLNYFRKKMDEARGKYANITDKMIDGIKANTKLGAVHDFSALKKDYNIAAKAEKMTNDLDELSKGDWTAEDVSDYVSKFNDTFVEDLTGYKNVKSISDLQAEVKKEYVGKESEVTTAWLKSNKEIINSVVKEGSLQIKQNYQKEKKALHKATQACHKFEKNLNVIGQWASATQKVLMYQHGYMMTIHEIEKMRYREYLSIAIRVTRGSTVSEAANFVQEAFNW